MLKVFSNPSFCVLKWPCTVFRFDGGVLYCCYINKLLPFDAFSYFIFCPSPFRCQNYAVSKYSLIVLWQELENHIWSKVGQWSVLPSKECFVTFIHKLVWMVHASLTRPCVLVRGWHELMWMVIQHKRHSVWSIKYRFNQDPSQT